MPISATDRVRRARDRGSIDARGSRAPHTTTSTTTTTTTTTREVRRGARRARANDARERRARARGGGDDEARARRAMRDGGCGAGRAGKIDEDRTRAMGTARDAGPGDGRLTSDGGSDAQSQYMDRADAKTNEGKTLPKPKIPTPKVAASGTTTSGNGANGSARDGDGRAKVTGSKEIPAPKIAAPVPKRVEDGRGQPASAASGKTSKAKPLANGGTKETHNAREGSNKIQDAVVPVAKTIPAPKGVKVSVNSTDGTATESKVAAESATKASPTPPIENLHISAVKPPLSPAKPVGVYVPPSQRGRSAVEDKSGSKRNKQKENFVNPRDDPDYRRGDGGVPTFKSSNDVRNDIARGGDKQSRTDTSTAKASSLTIESDEKDKKAQAAAQPGAKTTKEIRKALDENDIQTAMELFHTRSEAGLVNADASRLLLHYCIRTPGALLDGFAVASYATQKKFKITMRQFTEILMAFPQRANPIDAMEILNAMEPMIHYESKSIAKYHFHFARLVIQEFLEEALQTLDRIENAPSFGLQENGLAAMDVVIEPDRGGGPKGAAPKAGQLVLNIPMLGIELSRSLLKGDMLLLSRTGATDRSLTLGELPKGSRGLDENSRSRTGGYHAETEFEAEVVSSMNKVTVKLVGVGAETAATVYGGGWRIDKLANRTSFHRQLKAMEDMMQVKQGNSTKAGVDVNIRDTLIAGWDGNKEKHKEIPEMCEANLAEHMHIATRQKMIDQAKDIPAMQHMNQSQIDALMAALFNRVTLIQGPPGTGKTHTAVALVQMWLRCRTSPILCTSDSNIAVDNLVDGLARAGVRVARIGRPEAVRQDLMPYMIESIAGIDQDCRWSKQQQRSAITNALRQAEVICATCAGAGSDILEKYSFQACLIDEATQATEPATVIPLTKGCKQVVLIGDQNQLPPTIISREAEAAGLGESLFERFIRAGIRTYMLKVQYRMHPAIALFPSKTFYKGELLSGTPPSQRRAPVGFDWPVPAVPMAFVNVEEGAERSDGSSQTNPAEIQRVVNIVKKLAGQHEVLPGDIGVVTPYSAQARAIKKILRGNAPERTRFDAPADPTSMKAVEVATVDGFQGREKEVIVFSCTRANMNGNVGFLADTRRVNVMLTRAKRGLIIVGHMKTLQQDEIVWKGWLKWARESGLICGLSATDSDAANRLASIGMSAANEIGGTGIGQTYIQNALGKPVSWATGQLKESTSQPKLAERDVIPDAWDDSDDEENISTQGVNTITSVSSMTGMADEAWDSD